MAFAPSLSTTFLLIATVCILLPQAHAFGAGDIPDFAYLNGKLIDSSLTNPDVDATVDKAFRHGDIESILENLAKTAGGAAIGGSGWSLSHRGAIMILTLCRHPWLRCFSREGGCWPFQVQQERYQEGLLRKTFSLRNLGISDRW